MVLYQSRFVVVAFILSAMFRLLLRPILLLTLLAALPIFVIRAQPYDDSELRALLTPPEECPAPCFMGIRPGVTTVQVAVEMLRGHEWVADVNAANEADGYISVEWNRAAPPIIDRDARTPFYIFGGIVGFIDLKTTYPVGALYLLAGLPQATDSSVSTHGIFVSAYHFERSVMAYAYSSCPVTRTKFWKADMILRFEDWRMATGFSPINFAC